ncbi:MAG: hypothetical protein KA054_02425 [Candidatus Moranbacteria bacterium]|nr:hypothetical protein [Candidatus Moranbacteria bacterium]
MNTIIRIVCMAFFIIGSGTAAIAADVELANKFIVQSLDDGKFCGVVEVKIMRNPKKFSPVMILRHQVAKKGPEGRIERSGSMTEEVITLPIILSKESGFVWRCFDTLQNDQYQVSQWFILFAGKMYPIMFDDSAGGESNELIWDSSGQKVPEELIREEDMRREMEHEQKSKPNRNINGQQKKLT